MPAIYTEYTPSPGDSPETLRKKLDSLDSQVADVKRQFRELHAK